MRQASNVPPRIYLTGYMGAGKSTTGRNLANVLRYRFTDTDRVLVRRLKRTVSQVFAEEGEAFFREQELHLLEELCKESNIIISTGGGTLCRDETCEVAEKTGLVVYLRAPVEVLYERVIFSPKDRPMIDVPNPEETFKKRFARREVYYNRAHIIVDTYGKKSQDVAQEIVAAMADYHGADGANGVNGANGPVSE